MSVALAQAAAQQLRTALLDHGVRAVSLELQPGVAGSGWHVGTFKRGMGHHIASRPSQGATPGLAVVKNGRGGVNPLTGPLANGYGGFDLIARIITMGWANHPGAGGPWSVPGWGTVPVNNGRPYIFGWEFEGGFEPYTDEMHDFMARCGAGTLDWLGGAPVECWDEHKGWAGPRKPDRIGYTTASGRSRIATVLQGDDMDPVIAQKISEIHGVLFSGTPATPRALSVYARLVDVQTALTNALPQLLADAQKPGADPAAIAAAVVSAIPDDLAQDVLDGLAEKLASRPNPAA